MIERFLDDDRGGLAIRAIHDFALIDRSRGLSGCRPRGLLKRCLLRRREIRLLQIGVELRLNLLSELRRHFGFKLRVTRTRLPHRLVALIALHHFHHRAVRDVDIRRPIRIPFEAAAVLIAFAGRIDGVNQLSERRADDVLRETGLVFSPFRFDVTGLRILILDREADRSPEVLHHGPELLRRHLGVDPADIAVTHHLGGHGFGEHSRLSGRGAVRGRGLLPLLHAARRHVTRPLRDVIEVIVRNLGEIRRNFKRRARVA